jgi:hypothetical protein
MRVVVTLSKSGVLREAGVRERKTHFFDVKLGD